MNRQREKYSNEQFTYSLWSVSLFFFIFSDFRWWSVLVFFFLPVCCIFLCSFPLSLHFSSFFSCLVHPRSVAFCFRFSLRPFLWSSSFNSGSKSRHGGHELALGIKYENVVYYITRIQYTRDIIKHNDDFNEWTNTLLYKNISLTLYSREGWCWLCVRGELETRTDCCILTQSSSDHSSISFSFLAELLNRGSLKAQTPCMELVLTPLASYLQLTQPVCVLVIFLLAVHLLPLIYTGASFDWRLGRGSIFNNRSALLLYCLPLS